ncbi:MAG TPA: MATE family efflux transporter [Candidatus Intestinimonas pullistercoris]|uniref:MATE family efflux transporter n=1 Tax=Candidatus Intestinimonas pullistercoris TaxID=2838623 RepID=A0A9D2T1I5_9FIRM|nr:MATE family efflux transporter [uncultured Intestinimonas sp.]HJC42001.1 MATE family efflux transporter [Candidatus Intestinimonas pullistercoris]
MQNQITEGPILRPLLAFFFPILLGTFFQQLYNTVDAIIVGNYVGTAALGAVGGSTAIIINFLVNLFVGISSGATVVIAQHYGAQQGEDVYEAVHTAAALALAAGGVITIAGILLSGPALRLMDTPEDVMDYAVVYLRVYFCGTVASFVYNMGASILRAVGDTKHPLYFLMAACLTNIVLDLFFVAVLGLGVFGAALATVISQVVSAVLVAISLLRPGNVYSVVPREVRFHREKLVGILRIGLPAGIQSNMYTVSNMVLQSRMNLFGTVTVAAYTAFEKIDGFYWMISSAFGVSITTFVSQNFGARKYQRLRQGVRVCLALTAGVSLAISLLFCLGAPVLLRMFSPDGEVIALGTHMMWYISPFYILFVCIEIFSGTARGAGDALKPMLLTCGGVCVLRVAWVVVVLSHYPAVETILVSYPISWGITSLLYLIYYFRGNWLRRGIAKAGFPAEEDGTPAAAK